MKKKKKKKENIQANHYETNKTPKTPLSYFQVGHVLVGAG